MTVGGRSTVFDDASNPQNHWVLCGSSGIELGDLDYREADGSEEETWADDNSQFTRLFYCRWNQRFLFLQDLLGQNLLMSGNRISRRTPDQHPSYGNFFAVDAKVTGQGWRTKDTESKANYQRAKITATYRQLPYWVKTDTAVTVSSVQHEYDRYCSFSYGFDTAFVTDNCGTQGNTEGGSKVNLRRPIPATIPVMEMTITWHKVPGKDSNPFRVPTEATINAYQGSVNDRTFFDYPAGTVLFVGVDPKMTFATVDTDVEYEVPAIAWNIAYKFKVRKMSASGSGVAGWNYTRLCGEWVPVTYQNSTLGIYPSANLYDLWTIPS